MGVRKLIARLASGEHPLDASFGSVALFLPGGDIALVNSADLPRLQPVKIINARLPGGF